MKTNVQHNEKWNDNTVKQQRGYGHEKNHVLMVHIVKCNRIIQRPILGFANCIRLQHLEAWLDDGRGDSVYEQDVGDDPSVASASDCCLLFVCFCQHQGESWFATYLSSWCATLHVTLYFNWGGGGRPLLLHTKRIPFRTQRWLCQLPSARQRFAFRNADKPVHERHEYHKERKKHRAR